MSIANEQIILAVVGSDRPGLTRAIADAVFAAGGNWLQSHLSRLGGKYVGSVLVDVPAARFPELEAAVRAIDTDGLRVSIIAAAAEAPQPSGQTLVMEIVGQDRPGIVREVAAVLAGLEVNIEDFSSVIEASAWSGAPLFRARARLFVPAALPVDAVRHALERISGEIMVDFDADPDPA